MEDKQNDDNLNNASGVIYTDESSQNGQPESVDSPGASKFSGLFGDGGSSDKKKNIRNIIIIVVCVLLTYVILSSYFSENETVDEEIIPAMMEEEI